MRAVHHAHRVLDGDELRPGRRCGRSRCGRGTAGSARASPRSRCERLSFVETCTVSAQRCAAPRRSRSVSGAARQEVAAHARRTRRRRRRCIARIASTVSTPCSRGGVEAELGAERVEERRGAASRRCPSCGRPARCSGRAPGTGPAPGRPMLPRSSSRLTISWIVATACLCCVRPIAQQTIDRAPTATSSVGRPRAIVARGQPAGRDDARPTSIARQVRGQRVEAVAVLGDERRGRPRSRVDAADAVRSSREQRAGRRRRWTCRNSVGERACRGRRTPRARLRVPEPDQARPRAAG